MFVRKIIKPYIMLNNVSQAQSKALSGVCRRSRPSCTMAHILTRGLPSYRRPLALRRHSAARRNGGSTKYKVNPFGISECQRGKLSKIPVYIPGMSITPSSTRSNPNYRPLEYVAYIGNIRGVSGPEGKELRDTRTAWS